MEDISDPQCVVCKAIACRTGKQEKAPSFCHTVLDSKLVSEVFERYVKDPEVNRIALASSRVEAEYYMKNCRVEDTIAFAERIGAKKIGIATCVGLLEESRVFHDILKSHGFEVASICCKVGSIDKTRIGLGEDEKIEKGEFEPMCNPVTQAEILNKAGADLNVVIGLCVGHDTLFIKYSAAPVTVLIAKDRVFGHNPAAGLYLSNSYYTRLYKDKKGSLMSPPED